MPRAHAKSRAVVVDLSRERERRRLREYRERAQALLGANQLAFSRLFTTGTLYTRHGARAGRELLGTYQHLLRVTEVLGRLETLDAEKGVVRGREGRRLLSELESLVRRSKLLSSHADDLLSWFGP